MDIAFIAMNQIQVVNHNAGLDPQSVIPNGQFFEIELPCGETWPILYGNVSNGGLKFMINVVTGHSKLWSKNPPHVLLHERTYEMPLRIYDTSVRFLVPSSMFPADHIVWTLGETV